VVLHVVVLENGRRASLPTPHSFFLARRSRATVRRKKARKLGT
jgi:hypothetical protein